MNFLRYLGVYLNNRLNCTSHINNQILKARKAFMAFKKLFYKKTLSSEVKIIAYKSLIRPILTYGCLYGLILAQQILKNTENLREDALELVLTNGEIQFIIIKTIILINLYIMRKNGTNRQFCS